MAWSLPLYAAKDYDEDFPEQMAVASREEAAAALRVLLPPDLTPLPPPPSPPPPLPTLTNPFLNAAAAAGDSSNGTNPFKNVVTNLFSKRDYPSIDYGDFVLHPRNTTCYHDLEDPVAVHVNSAELMVRRYARDLEGYPSIKDIVELNFVENKTLEQKFLVTDITYESLGRIMELNGSNLFQREKDERVWFGQEAESNEVILFHGTQSSSAHSICSGNFDLSKSKRSLYGTGIYLSPCPNISLDYGDDIVVCRVLLGKKQTPKYDGKDKLMEVSCRMNGPRLSCKSYFSYI